MKRIILAGGSGFLGHPLAGHFQKAGHEVVILTRSAMVMGNRENSVFPVLQKLAWFGLGGKMGSGKQFVSWIHEADFCRAVEWLIAHEDFNGAVNLCAP